VDVRHCDTLVLGAGTAGCVVAARLAAAGRERVTLVESGPDYGPRGGGRWPAALLAWGTLVASHDWGYYADPGNGVPGIWLQRGRVIGGSSSVNACGLYWGTRADFDAWAALGNPGWGYDDLLPYLQRVEDDPAGPGAQHGRGGPVRVYRVAEADLNPLQRAYLEACTALGYPWLPDVNDGSGRPGIGILPKSVEGDVRCTSAFAYLDPVRARLTVLADHLVDRLRWQGDRAAGAVLLGPDGQVEVAAERVVLAAGVFGTPAILQRSGIGPPDWLRALGLTRLHPLPGVGENLLDHPGAVVELAAEPTAYAALGALEARGALAGSEVVLRGQADPAADHYDLHGLLYGTWQPPGDPLYGRYRLILYAMRPRSRGSVAIRSLDPKAPPLIRPNYLSDPADVATLVAAVRLARAIAAQPALDEVITGVLAPDAATRSDDDLAAFARRSLRTFNHSAGTCRLGPADDPLAVAGPDGRVHGFANLYVADASLMPRLPSVATNHTTFAIAEKIAAGLLE